MDPLLTAFKLSWELRNLAFAEQECKSEYLELRRQCQQFAVDLLDQSRSSQELAIILNHDPESPEYADGDHMKLARLEIAINFKQKKVRFGSTNKFQYLNIPNSFSVRFLVSVCRPSKHSTIAGCTLVWGSARFPA